MIQQETVVTSETLRDAALQGDDIRPLAIRILLDGDHHLPVRGDGQTSQGLTSPTCYRILKGRNRLQDEAELRVDGVDELDKIHLPSFISQAVVDGRPFLIESEGDGLKLWLDFDGGKVDAADSRVTHDSSPSVCPRCDGVVTGEASPASVERTEGDPSPTPVDDGSFNEVLVGMVYRMYVDFEERISKREGVEARPFEVRLEFKKELGHLFSLLAPLAPQTNAGRSRPAWLALDDHTLVATDKHGLAVRTWHGKLGLNVDMSDGLGSATIDPDEIPSLIAMLTEAQRRIEAGEVK